MPCWSSWASIFCSSLEVFAHSFSLSFLYTASLTQSKDSDCLWPFKLSWGFRHLLIFCLLKETLSFLSCVAKPLSVLNWIALLVVSAGNVRPWPIGLSSCLVSVFLRLVVFPLRNHSLLESNALQCIVFSFPKIINLCIVDFCIV